MKRPTERDYCKKCERHRMVVGQMSHTGQCGECAATALVENVVGLMTHSGPAFDRWRRAMARSVGAIPIDELAETG